MDNYREKVQDIFGYWPLFCDAEVYDICYKEYKENKVFYLKLLYSDMDERKSILITLAFEDIIDIEISNIMSQNVIDQIDIMETDNNFRVEINSAVGLSGKIKARKITSEVHNVINF